jgi:hypothetical protein
MKVRRTLLMLAVVSLTAIPLLAKNNVPGDVPAPEWAADPVYPDDGYIVFDWTDVEEAEKYSLCFEGVLEVDYTIDDTEYLDVEVEFSFCFGTSDRTDGGEIGDSYLSILYDDFLAAQDTAIEEALYDQLGILPDEVDEVDWIAFTAKVKGLDPHDKEDLERQNNAFSEDLDLLSIF